MKRTLLSLTVALFLGATLNPFAANASDLRVLTHSAFALPKPLLDQFEAENGVKLRLIKTGDAGEMLNKLILTRAAPIADVVFGIDNALVGKALAANVLDDYSGPAATRTSSVSLPSPVVPVDFGYVSINYDKAWFAKSKMPLPKSIQELTLPRYAKLLAVQNPATSSTGNAFMLATIGSMGEEKAFDWWARMRKNGLKVANGWSEAYYTEFSQNGGAYPMVVSYAASPAAELFYSHGKLKTPPTGSLSLPGAVFRQVEGVALVKDGSARAAAGKFIEFLRSPAVQKGMQTEMWMYPVEPGVPTAEALRFAPAPSAYYSPSAQDIATKGSGWMARWIKVVLK
jgi:thiamine transport system substrate-binding protein